MALEIPLCRARKAHDFRKLPDVSLSQARERHAGARKLLATGIDPMAERKAEKAAIENSSLGLLQNNDSQDTALRVAEAHIDDLSANLFYGDRRIKLISSICRAH
jgi:hypothetical protein